MKIPDSSDEGFKEQEIELLKKWVEELKNSLEGKRVLENIEKESNVSDKIWEKFLVNLIHRLKEGDKGLDALRNSIEDDMLLKGPSVNEESDYLSKLVKAGSLFRYLKDDIPIYADKRGEEKLCKWIDDRSLKIKNDFKNIKFRGIRPIVWATFSDEIDRSKPFNDDIDDLCDRLGLLDFENCDYVLELRYESKNIENKRVPTIIEGGENPAFQPCDEGDNCGYTLDLKNGDWGVLEIVHEPIDFHEIDSLSYLGHKEKNPEPFWEKNNKSLRRNPDEH